MNEQTSTLLGQLREVRDRVINETLEIAEDEYPYKSSHWRWTTVRRILLRFGDHMREHSTQIRAKREAISGPPAMTLRLLAEAEEAYGKLLAAVVGLTDQELNSVPEGADWSIKQALEHILESELWYLQEIQRARTTGELAPPEIR